MLGNCTAEAGFSPRHHRRYCRLVCPGITMHRVQPHRKEPAHDSSHASVKHGEGGAGPIHRPL
jgi:ribosomal protein L44E